MKKRLEIEQKKVSIVKAVRAAVRLKYSLLADAEINDVVPDVEAAYDKTSAAGKKFELDIASLLDRAVK